MSAIEYYEIEVPVGLLEIDNDSYPSDLYNHLKMVNSILANLSYSGPFHSQTWKHDVFAEYE